MSLVADQVLINRIEHDLLLQIAEIARRFAYFDVEMGTRPNTNSFIERDKAKMELINLMATEGYVLPNQAELSREIRRRARQYVKQEVAA